MTIKSGGVTAASKRLRIGQPSLSSQLKVLEDLLNIKLFYKVGRTNQLTPEGSLVYGFCRQMFELSEEMHELLSNKMPFASRRFYIGVSNEVANSFVVEVISHFLKQFDPSLRPKIIMISAKHERLVEQLHFREIDVIVSHFAVTSSDLENIEQVKVPVNLVYESKEKLPKKRNYKDILPLIYTLTKQLEPQWIMPASNFKLRIEINKYFEANSIKGRIAFESDVVESLIRSVVDGIGFAFLPSVYMTKEIKNHSIYQFGPKNGFWQYRLSLACHSQSQNDHLIKSLAISFKQALNDSTS